MARRMSRAASRLAIGRLPSRVRRSASSRSSSGVVERPHDRRDRLADEPGADRAELPAADVGRQEEDSLAAGPRPREVVFPGQADAVPDGIGGEPRDVEEVDERRADPLGGSPADRRDLLRRLFRERAREVREEDAPPGRNEAQVEPAEPAPERLARGRGERPQRRFAGAKQRVLGSVTRRGSGAHDFGRVRRAGRGQARGEKGEEPGLQNLDREAHREQGQRSSCPRA